MSQPRLILIQNALGYISADICFRDRWSSVSSIQKAMQTRYTLKQCICTKNNISRALSKLEPHIDSMSIKHPSGIYKGQFKKESYYFLQNGKSDPSSFPDTKRTNKEEWDMINLVDQTKLEKYANIILNIKGRIHTPKNARLTR